MHSKKKRILVEKKQKTRMDDVFDHYFENIFDNLRRESLGNRRKRQALVEHIKNTINILSNVRCLTREAGCRATVTAIIHYHRKALRKNSFTCLFGKYHNVLYIAVKLCFDFRLIDTVVAELLNEIFYCEKTFERIFAGAIYGVTVAHFTAGWKSDFRDQKENISAVGYFLEEAAARNLSFLVQTNSGTEMRKLADVPVTQFNRATPLVVALQVMNYEMVLLLLRFDAGFYFRFFEVYPPGEEKTQKELECVRLLFRAAPSICTLDRRNSRYEDFSCVKLCSPLGVVPPKLKHLCRCEIRNVLRMKSMLPLGIERLGLPKTLSDYLDLLLD